MDDPNSHKENSINFLETDFFTKQESNIKSLDVEDLQYFSLQEGFNIPNDSISKAYDIVVELFDQERFVDASHALFFLITINPTSPELQVALGHSEYHCGQVDAALGAYILAYCLDVTNPLPLLYAAHCLDKNQDYDASLECIDQLLGILEEGHDTDKIKKEALELKAQVEGNKALKFSK